MSRRLKQTTLLVVVVVAAAQLVRPDRGNPPIDQNLTIEAQAGTASGLAAVVNRSCRDCHTNATVWPGYAKVAPLSWLMAYSVTKGREAVNFSEWASYSPNRQRRLLGASCDDVTSGKMPGVYTLLRPETRLSARDVETFCKDLR